MALSGRVETRPLKVPEKTSRPMLPGNSSVSITQNRNGHFAQSGNRRGEEGQSGFLTPLVRLQEAVGRAGVKPSSSKPVMRNLRQRTICLNPQGQFRSPGTGGYSEEQNQRSKGIDQKLKMVTIWRTLGRIVRE